MRRRRSRTFAPSRAAPLCRSSSTTIRSRMLSTSRRRCSSSSRQIENLVAIKESSDDVRRITDLRNAVGDRYHALLRRRRPGTGERSPGGDRLGLGHGASRSRRRTSTSGIWPSRRLQGRARDLRWYTPLLHLDTQVKFVQYIKLAIQEAGLGAEWVRAPRLPLEGEERDASSRSSIAASRRDRGSRCGSRRHERRAGAGHRFAHRRRADARGDRRRSGTRRARCRSGSHSSASNTIPSARP